MNTKHNFVQLAEVQREQGTLYCAGLDIHPFGGWAESIRVYESVIRTIRDKDYFQEAFRRYYLAIGALYPVDKAGTDLSTLLASIECYLVRVIDVLVTRADIRVFKPQAAFYAQFGPLGWMLLSRVRQYLASLEIRDKKRLIVILDCKVGDIDTTQAAYFSGLLGNLQSDWGIDYAPFNFDIINVTPWMGSDVLVLGTAEKPGIGLKLMQEGKGLIVVNKSSNPSGPEYQDLCTISWDYSSKIHMFNVKHLQAVSRDYGLEQDGLSSLGLVVGATRPCDGSIRTAFPSATMLVPGFGAQGGKFSLIMPELISEGKWNGQGAIFSSSRGTMFPWLEKLGGSGDVGKLEEDLIKAVEQFRINERLAYDEPEIKERGIKYPFDRFA